MLDISKIIETLNKENNNSYEFVVYGTPTNETEYQQNVKYVSGTDENGSATFHSTQPYTWSQILGKEAQVDKDIAMEKLRIKRNKLLQDTDYLALSDNTLSAEMTTYRQSLRNITEGLTTVEQIQAVVFPTKPE